VDGSKTAPIACELVRSGWKHRRTMVMCEWTDGTPGYSARQNGEANTRSSFTSESLSLMINTDVGVTGPTFSDWATPLLKELCVNGARDKRSPVGEAFMIMWLEHSSTRNKSAAQRYPRGRSFNAEISLRDSVGAFGSGSDFCLLRICGISLRWTLGFQC